MNFRQLTRNKDAIRDAVMELPNDTLVAKRPLTVCIPKRYTEGNLGYIKEDIKTLAIFAIIVGNQYAVHSAITQVHLNITQIENLVYESEEYILVSYDKGEVIFKNMHVVIDAELVYESFNRTISLGFVPWFFDYATYVDLARMFDYSGKYAKLQLGIDISIMDLVVSAVARSKSNPQILYKHGLVDRRKVGEVEYIGLKNVMFGASNTTAKLMGSYFDDGLDSALAMPSKKVESIERMLRS